MIIIAKKYSLKKRIRKFLKLANKSLKICGVFGFPKDTKIYEKGDLDEIMKLEKGEKI